MYQTVTASDGHELESWVESTNGHAKGGVIILQEIFGVTDQLKQVAKNYAEEGFEVWIPALYDRQQKRCIVSFDNIEEARARRQQTLLRDTMMDIRACVAELKTRYKSVGCVGFCWGGGLAFHAAQVLPIEASVAFYGTALDSYFGEPLNAAFLGHMGKTDPVTPPDLIQRLREKYPQADVYEYEAGHAFANDQRPSYVPDAAELAHTRTLAFLAKHLN